MAYASAEKEFYQRHYEGQLQTRRTYSLDEIRATHFLPGQRYHLLLTELRKGNTYGTVVEVGCADGDCIVFLAKEFQFAQAIGIDIGFPDDMAQEIEKVRFIQANSNQRLPLEDSSVDVFVAMMVIEHLFDPFHAFQEIKRVLSPTGMAFINLPLVTSLKNRLRLLCGRLPITSVPFDKWLVDREWDGNHLHYFSLDSICRLSEACGLKVVRQAGVGSFHRLKTAAPRMLANEISFVVQHS
jgi:SAM-dependent methyltransferase